MYHPMSRGDRREPIFLDDVDRQDFLKSRRDTQSNLIAWEKSFSTRG